MLLCSDPAGLNHSLEPRRLANWLSRATRGPLEPTWLFRAFRSLQLALYSLPGLQLALAKQNPYETGRHRALGLPSAKQISMAAGALRRNSQNASQRPSWSHCLTGFAANGALATQKFVLARAGYPLRKP